MTLSLPWLTLLLLGASHGINPAMGWLFAVARGLQEGTDAAVWRTLYPLAIGHAFAVAAVIGVAVLIGLAVPVASLRWIVAAILFGFGLYRLFRHGHPSAGGMRVGAGRLTLWSFLMASAHGAGLMVLPFILGADVARAQDRHSPAHGEHSALIDAWPTSIVGEELTGLIAALIHTAGYLAVTGLIAVVVYRKVGLRLLRKAWINLDLIWGAVLIATAILTPLL